MTWTSPSRNLKYLTKRALVPAVSCQIGTKVAASAYRSRKGNVQTRLVHCSFGFPQKVYHLRQNSPGVKKKLKNALEVVLFLQLATNSIYSKATKAFEDHASVACCSPSLVWTDKALMYYFARSDLWQAKVPWNRYNVVETSIRYRYHSRV